MASVPTQEEILAATRKNQEAMIAAIKNWFETVRTATPKLTSVYAPLTDRLPKLTPVSLPFADKLPTPKDAVGSAYDLAEQLLASQRKFAEDLLKAMTPLMPVRSQTTPKGDGSSEPEVPGHQVWRDAVTASEPKPAAVSADPKAPVRPAAKSTPARPAPGTAAKSTAAKSTAGRSTAGRNTTAKSAPKRTTASRAPKGTDAG